MSVLKLSANTDYDAAQALLDLQNISRIDQGVNRPVIELRENMEDTAKLFLSCFISSNVTKTTNLCVNQNADQERLEKILNKPENNSHTMNSVSESCNKRSRIFKRRPMRHVPDFTTTNFNNDDFNNRNKSVSSATKTRDIGTQTELEFNIPKIEILETTIRNLYEKIQVLEARIKESNTTVVSQPPVSLNKSHSHSDEIDSEFDLNDECEEEHVNTTGTFNDEEYESPAKKFASSNTQRHHNQSTDANDMISIGEGHAMVPYRLFRHINWNSYTSATRKLLTAVFSRSVLATHSLTGKPSPAFPNKPAKKKLDPALVNDIVQTVVEKCSVPENVVRTSITTKCADESKMYRTRQKNTRKRKQKTNRENVPPDSTSNSEG